MAQSLAFGDLGFHYDSRPTLTTAAATCATREVSCSTSFYRGEQFDSDLGLYYLRARYYNPNTGRFLSRDPENGKAKDPKTLHKYLYAGGDPINAMDPRGRDDIVEYLFFNLPNRIFIFTQIYVPTYIGTLQFYGTVGAAIATVAGWVCEVSDACGPQDPDPGPGPFEPEGPLPVAPGGAGAMH